MAKGSKSREPKVRPEIQAERDAHQREVAYRNTPCCPQCLERIRQLELEVEGLLLVARQVAQDALDRERRDNESG